MVGLGWGEQVREQMRIHGKIEIEHLQEWRGVPGLRPVRCTRQRRGAGQATAQLPHLPGQATAEGESRVVPRCHESLSRHSAMRCGSTRPQ